MLKLQKNERVDWFRITVDIDALAKMAEIPRSTIQGWRYRNARPKLEEGIRLLHLWLDITEKEIEHIPVYNPFIHDCNQ